MRTVYCIVLVAWCCVEGVLLTCILSGWAQLLEVLEREGYFSSLCDEADGVSGNTTATNGDTVCTRQDNILNLLYSLASFSISIAFFPSGKFLDTYGFMKTRVLSCTIFLIAGIFVYISTLGYHEMIFPGLILTCIGGSFFMSCLVKMCGLIPRRRGTVVSLINSAIDLSGVMLLFCKFTYIAGFSFSNIVIVYYTFCVAHGILFTFTLFPKSSTLYVKEIVTLENDFKMEQGENENKKDDPCKNAYLDFPSSEIIYSFATNEFVPVIENNIGNLKESVSFSFKGENEFVQRWESNPHSGLHSGEILYLQANEYVTVIENRIEDGGRDTSSEDLFSCSSVSEITEVSERKGSLPFQRASNEYYVTNENTYGDATKSNLSLCGFVGNEREEPKKELTESMFPNCEKDAENSGIIIQNHIEENNISSVDNHIGEYYRLDETFPFTVPENNGSEGENCTQITYLSSESSSEDEQKWEEPFNLFQTASSKSASWKEKGGEEWNLSSDGEDTVICGEYFQLNHKESNDLGMVPENNTSVKEIEDVCSPSSSDGEDTAMCGEYFQLNHKESKDLGMVPENNTSVKEIEDVCSPSSSEGTGVCVDYFQLVSRESEGFDTVLKNSTWFEEKATAEDDSPSPSDGEECDKYFQLDPRESEGFATVLENKACFEERRTEEKCPPVIFPKEECDEGFQLLETLLTKSGCDICTVLGNIVNNEGTDMAKINDPSSRNTLTNGMGPFENYIVSNGAIYSTSKTEEERCSSSCSIRPLVSPNTENINEQEHMQYNTMQDVKRRSIVSADEDLKEDRNHLEFALSGSLDNISKTRPKRTAVVHTDESFLKNAKSTKYILHTVFTSVMLVRTRSFVGMLNLNLKRLTNDPEEVDFYLTLFATIVFVEIILCFIPGTMLDWKPKSKHENYSLVICFFLANVFSIFLTVGFIIPSLKLQVDCWKMQLERIQKRTRKKDLLDLSSVFYHLVII